MYIFVSHIRRSQAPFSVACVSFYFYESLSRFELLQLLILKFQVSLQRATILRMYAIMYARHTET